MIVFLFKMIKLWYLTKHKEIFKKTTIYLHKNLFGKVKDQTQVKQILNVKIFIKKNYLETNFSSNLIDKKDNTQK